MIEKKEERIEDREYELKKCNEKVESLKKKGDERDKGEIKKLEKQV